MHCQESMGSNSDHNISLLNKVEHSRGSNRSVEMEEISRWIVRQLAGMLAMLRLGEMYATSTSPGEGPRIEMWDMRNGGEGRKRSVALGDFVTNR